MDVCLATTDLQYPPRVVLVVHDAAVALAALEHDAGLEARVREREGAGRLVRAGRQPGVLLHAPPLLGQGLLALAAHVQDHAADDGGEADHAHHHAGGDGGLVRARVADGRRRLREVDDGRHGRAGLGDEDGARAHFARRVVTTAAAAPAAVVRRRSGIRGARGRGRYDVDGAGWVAGLVAVLVDSIGTVTTTCEDGQLKLEKGEMNLWKRWSGLHFC